MPNHTESRLKIKGSISEIKALVESVKGKDTPFSFNSIIPQPEGIYLGNLGSKEEKEYPLNWYTWNVENWGTKWDAYDVASFIPDLANSIDFVDSKLKVTIYYLFQTAWNPVPIVITKLSETFPNLEIQYAFQVEGCNGHGVEIYKNGSVIKILKATQIRRYLNIPDNYR